MFILNLIVITYDVCKPVVILNLFNYLKSLSGYLSPVS
jgi:hypothetical protein